MGKNNYPQSGLDNVEPEVMHEIVHSLRELHELGRPKTDEEVQERIDDYFSFCERSSLRPGVESLCMALHISRTTLFRWNNGEDCSEARREMIQSAKSFIGSFLEQTMLCGKISPPSGIFLMKNWLSYKDTISLEESAPQHDKRKILADAKLPDLSRMHQDDSNLPHISISDDAGDTE